MTPTLAVSDLTKMYNDVPVVAGLDLSLEPGSLTALLGPSGCGKSTTLQMIAGLVRPDAGRIDIAGVNVSSVPAERRTVSLVFQKPLLFPHLTVAQNVAFGLRMQRVARSSITQRVDTILDRVQLTGLGHRRPHELSGGQEQRVALARALVLDPPLLLLDEPFSQLDASLRVEMRTLVRELHDASGVTTLFVTHDQSEAVELADHIVVMFDGSIEASGSPESLYMAPPTLATARFLGSINELQGTAANSSFSVAGHAISLPVREVKGPAVAVMRPESLRLTSPTEEGALGVVVDSVRFAGTHLVVSCHTEDHQVATAHVPIGTVVQVGERAGLAFSPEQCTVFEGTRP